MVEAKLLRKKLKNGLIVDKWDLVTIIEKQQAEIDSLRKNLDVALMIVNEPAKTLTEPSVKEITELWLYVVNNKPVNDKRPIEWHFANAILRKAQEK
jgi:hypothetical protein